MSSSERISVHSLSDLKNTTDDALPVYLNSLSFTQSHILSDTRLLIGYSSFILCAATFWWDYTYGFPATKSYTAISVVVYFLLNTILTFWIFYVEAGTIYIGTSPKTGKTIQISSKTKKHVPIYELTIKVWGKGKGRGDREEEVVVLKRGFNEWFDAKGGFVAKPLQELLASNVGVVGEADPKRVVQEKNLKKRLVEKVKAEEGTDKGGNMSDKWEALLKESSGETAAVATGSEKKGGKKRGKKA